MNNAEHSPEERHMATMTSGTLEELSILHDHTLDDEHVHKMVHDVVMNVTGDYTIDEHHETLARWRPGWGKRETS